MGEWPKFEAIVVGPSKSDYLERARTGSAPLLILLFSLFLSVFSCVSSRNALGSCLVPTWRARERHEQKVKHWSHGRDSELRLRANVFFFLSFLRLLGGFGVLL